MIINRVNIDYVLKNQSNGLISNIISFNFQPFKKKGKKKPAKERLGTKPSDFRPKNLELEKHDSVKDRLGERRGNIFDRIQPIPGEDTTNKPSTSVKLRIGPTNTEKREAQRKSRKTRDLASTRQRFPREAKDSQTTKCNQIGGYIFHTREEDTTDSEEETYKASKSKE